MLGLADAIKAQIPENIDYETTAKILSVDPSPLNVVLLQEVRARLCVRRMKFKVVCVCAAVSDLFSD